MENNTSLKEAMNKIAMEYFLFGKEPSMDLNDDNNSSASQKSTKSTSSSQNSSNSNNNSKKSKPPKKPEDTTSQIKKLQPKLPSKKTTKSTFEFEDSLPTGFTHISPKQQTSKFKDIQAKEVDESTREKYGEIYSQQPFSSPSITNSLIDLGFSDED